MAFRLIVLSALLLSVASGASLHYQLGHASPQISIGQYKGLEHHEEEHHAPAHYTFSYKVEDPHTGDIKSQHESRVGDKVEGEYSLVEPDGHHIRIVKYTADKHSGFNAVVHREATKHIVKQPLVIKSTGHYAVHQPILKNYHF